MQWTYCVLIALFGLSCLTTVTGLECYVCNVYASNTTAEIEACREDPFNKTTTEVELQTCPDKPEPMIVCDEEDDADQEDVKMGNTTKTDGNYTTVDMVATTKTVDMEATTSSNCREVYPDPPVVASCFSLKTVRSGLTNKRVKGVLNTVVSRFCGFAKEGTNSCKQKYGVEADTRVCTCQEDGCNTATGPLLSGFLMTVLLSMLVFLH